MQLHLYIPHEQTNPQPQKAEQRLLEVRGVRWEETGPTDVFSISSWGWFHGYVRVLSKLYTLHTYGLLFVN